ncbi:hypothetical protein U9M48_000383 [Paspalum notatum var. saurae]|uniref:Reverse transcriptase Ty1/copia-type domain-containing protein n=1 Tax=Paspalum notatum var. saurae TaxID=547442 RepID=A0AAQ3SCC7_PASNO
MRNLLDTTEEIIEYEYSGMCLLAAEEPTSVEEALGDEAWRLAMESELQSFRDNKTWEFATLPAGHKAIGLKWVFKVKKDPAGNVIKYKARLVAKGYAHHLVLLKKELLGLGFVRNPLEHAVYRRGSDQEILLVGFYVDDLIITGPSSREIDVFKEQMKENFSMSDLGLLSYYLGIEVCQTEGSITVCQSAYARKILENAGMSECNMCHTPMENGLKLSKKEDVGIVSRYMENPKSRHWAAVKQILRYVAGTINYGCRFRRQSAAECRLVGFSDSDHAGDVDDRKEYHWCVDEGKIDVRHVGTEEQLADILTKALGKVRFVELRQQLGVVNLQRD